MRQYVCVVALLAILAIGCGAGSPVGTEMLRDGGDPEVSDFKTNENYAGYDERYRLWGEWTWHVSADHRSIEVVPKREGGFHVNILKWLEEDCGNCVLITKVKNNGDSTVDVSVRIRHPKYGNPVYTAFDVKGIVMFRGSYEMSFPLPLPDPHPQHINMSWREMGDPELLNADGHTIRWSPTYDSGSPFPIMNYYPGKYSKGTPTANLNGYLNHYTDEERHMFSCTGEVTRDYHIYLPPGPNEIGYAVEACWAMPDSIPVTDPLTDFPPEANMAEPYYLRFVLNDGQPITQEECCLGLQDTCDELRLEILTWGDVQGMVFSVITPEPYPGSPMYHAYKHCSKPYQQWWCGVQSYPIVWINPDGYPDGYPDGKYRGMAACMKGQPIEQISYLIYDFIVDNG